MAYWNGLRTMMQPMQLCNACLSNVCHASGAIVNAMALQTVIELEGMMMCCCHPAYIKMMQAHVSMMQGPHCWQQQQPLLKHWPSRK